MQQGRRGSDFIGNSVRYEVTFIDKDWNTHSEMLCWDGETATCSTTIDFEPVAVFCDYNNKFADANHDMTVVINKTGNHSLHSEKFKAIVEEISDSTLMRVEHHWMGANTASELPEGLTISQDRYWSIYRLDKGNAKIKGEFQYQKNANYDENLMVSENDSIVLLYRANGSQPWQSISYEHQGQNNFGRMTVDDVKSGDYTLGMWDEEHAAIEELNKETDFEIFPNPAKDKINIKLQNETEGRIIMMNQAGQIVKDVVVSGKEMTIETDELASGIYNLKLEEAKNQTLRKVVIL
jgi:hypothetical protein